MIDVTDNVGGGNGEAGRNGECRQGEVVAAACTGIQGPFK